MAGMKKIIKADSEEARQINEKNDRIGKRRFGESLFHGMNPNAASQSEVVNAPDTQDNEQEIPSGDEPVSREVQLESFRRDNGEIAGVRITCKCGEVIDLEFSYEDAGEDSDLFDEDYGPDKEEVPAADEFPDFTEELPDEDGASPV